MTHEQYKDASQYWDKKESVPMPEAELKKAVYDYINANNTCALAADRQSFLKSTAKTIEADNFQLG